MEIKGIIFDYGGTIDSFGDHWSEVIFDGYKAAGVEIDKTEFRTSYVFAERELARKRYIYPQHNFLDLMRIKIDIELRDLAARGIIDSTVAEQATEPIAQYCYQRARRSVETVKPVIERLAEKYPLMLVSNFYGNVESVVRDMGIRHCFQGIIESAVVGVRKPDPRIFRLGVIALGLKPEEVLVIGDSFRKDIEPALSLGCHVAWIKGKGWTAEEDAQIHPSIISSLDELLTLVN